MPDWKSAALKECLGYLFGRAKRRGDARALAHAKPSSPRPLLVQDGQEILQVAVANGLLLALAERGGSSASVAGLAGMQRKLWRSFEPSEQAFVEEEILRVLIWLEESLRGEQVDASPEDGWPSFVLGSRPALIASAMADEKDLYLSFLETAIGRYRQVRVRPERLLEAAAEPTALVARELPQGTWLEVPLRRIRWLMVIARWGDVPAERLAEVLPFAAPRKD